MRVVSVCRMPSRPPWTQGLPARRLVTARDAELPESDVWPLTIPAVAQVLADGERMRQAFLNRLDKREKEEE